MNTVVFTSIASIFTCIKNLSAQIQVYTQVSSPLQLEFHCCGAVIIAEGTGSEVNPRVDLPLALVVLALPRVCLLPSEFLLYRQVVPEILEMQDFDG